MDGYGNIKSLEEEIRPAFWQQREPKC